MIQVQAPTINGEMEETMSVKDRGLHMENRVQRELTLLGPAYLSVSKDHVGHIAPSLNILGLGRVRVPILFGNDLLWNDLPHSKEFMKFGCLEPSKIMFDQLLKCYVG